MKQRSKRSAPRAAARSDEDGGDIHLQVWFSAAGAVVCCCCTRGGEANISLACMSYRRLLPALPRLHRLRQTLEGYHTPPHRPFFPTRPFRPNYGMQRVYNICMEARHGRGASPKLLCDLPQVDSIRLLEHFWGQGVCTRRVEVVRGMGWERGGYSGEGLSV